VEVRQGDPFGETGSLTRGFVGATDGGVQPPSTEVVLTSLQLSEGGDKIRRSEGGKRADANMDRDYRALQWGRTVARSHRRRPDYGADVMRGASASILPAMCGQECVSQRRSVRCADGRAGNIRREASVDQSRSTLRWPPVEEARSPVDNSGQGRSQHAGRSM
jgi:hypothetical protein